MQQYSDLEELLQKDSEASQLFSSLPEYVRDSIWERGGNVHTLDSLQGYADNLLAGDK